MRRDANKLLQEEGQALWNELMAYEYEYSEDIEDLKEAWDIANGAMNTYNNGQLNVMQTLRTMIDMMKEYNRQLDMLNNSSYSNLVNSMKANSEQWNNASDSERASLHQANQQLAQEYNDALGTEALKYNSGDGRWYLNDMPLYHDGAESGFVLQNKFPALKSNEIFAKLATGELVLTPPQLQRLAKTLFQIGVATPGVQTPQYAVDKLIEVNIENINDTKLPDVEKIMDRAVDRAIKKLTDPLTRKGIGGSAQRILI